MEPESADGVSRNAPVKEEKMKFDTILFDFDGTLFDTSPGVFNSFDYLFKKYQMEFPREKYSLMIGPPLKESFQNIIGFKEEECDKAMKVYREYYGVKGIFECDVYGGVKKLVEDLRENGKNVFVATSKPEVYANAILEKKDMKSLFDFVGGSDLEEKNRVEKIDIINYVLESNGIKDESSKEKVLMIGDRKYDIIGAHQAGIKCCGILWGFGNRKEFEEFGADFICETPKDVMNLVCPPPFERNNSSDIRPCRCS